MTTFSEIMTLDEASRFLKISKKTLYNLAKQGVIPGRKVGREWRFVCSSLVEWLKEARKEEKPCWEIKGCSKKLRDKCKVYKAYSLEQAKK